MKKIIFLAIATLILTSCLTPFALAVENEVSVVLNGFEVIFDVPGRLIGDRTMVGLRKTAEALGAEVRWIGETREIILERNGDEIKLAIDSYDLYKNGELSYTMDTAPVIIEESGESRTLVPLRAISEAFGCTVTWDGATRTAYISDISDKTVLTVESYPIDYDLYSYFANYYLSTYPDLYNLVDNSEQIAEIQASVIDVLIEYAAIMKLSSQNGLSIYEPEIKDAVDIAVEDYRTFYSDAFDEILSSSHMTEKVFKDMLYITVFGASLSSRIANTYNSIPNEERADILLGDATYIRCAHIFNEDYSVLESILDSAKTATDEEFFALVNEYGTDPGAVSEPTGYYFSYGEMVEEFESAAFDLAENQTSDIIASPFGYHIIRRLPKDISYIENNIESLYKTYAENRYYCQLLDAADSLSDQITYLPAYNDIDFYSEFVEPLKADLDNIQITDEDSFSDTPTTDVDETDTTVDEY